MHVHKYLQYKENLGFLSYLSHWMDKVIEMLSELHIMEDQLTQWAEKYRHTVFPFRLSMASTSVLSLRSSFPWITSCTFLGLHGNSCPSLSFITQEYPSQVISFPVSPSINTNFGIPWTRYFLVNLACEIKSILLQNHLHALGMSTK